MSNFFDNGIWRTRFLPHKFPPEKKFVIKRTGKSATRSVLSGKELIPPNTVVRYFLPCFPAEKEIPFRLALSTSKEPNFNHVWNPGFFELSKSLELVVTNNLTLHIPFFLNIVVKPYLKSKFSDSFVGSFIKTFVKSIEPRLTLPQESFFYGIFCLEFLSTQREQTLLREVLQLPKDVLSISSKFLWQCPAFSKLQISCSDQKLLLQIDTFRDKYHECRIVSNRILALGISDFKKTITKRKIDFTCNRNFVKSDKSFLKFVVVSEKTFERTAVDQILTRYLVSSKILVPNEYFSAGFKFKKLGVKWNFVSFKIINKLIPFTLKQKIEYLYPSVISLNMLYLPTFPLPKIGVTPRRKYDYLTSRGFEKRWLNFSMAMKTVFTIPGRIFKGLRTVKLSAKFLIIPLKFLGYTEKFLIIVSKKLPLKKSVTQNVYCSAISKNFVFTNFAKNKFISFVQVFCKLVSKCHFISKHSLSVPPKKIQFLPIKMRKILGRFAPFTKLPLQIYKSECVYYNLSKLCREYSTFSNSSISLEDAFYKECLMPFLLLVFMPLSGIRSLERPRRCYASVHKFYYSESKSWLASRLASLKFYYFTFDVKFSFVSLSEKRTKILIQRHILDQALFSNYIKAFYESFVMFTNSNSNWSGTIHGFLLKKYDFFGPLTPHPKSMKFRNFHFVISDFFLPNRALNVLPSEYFNKDFVYKPIYKFVVSNLELGTMKPSVPVLSLKILTNFPKFKFCFSVSNVIYSNSEFILRIIPRHRSPYSLKEPRKWFYPFKPAISLMVVSYELANASEKEPKNGTYKTLPLSMDLTFKSIELFLPWIKERRKHFSLLSFTVNFIKSRNSSQFGAYSFCKYFQPKIEDNRKLSFLFINDDLPNISDYRSKNIFLKVGVLPLKFNLPEKFVASELFLKSRFSAVPVYSDRFPKIKFAEFDCSPETYLGFNEQRRMNEVVEWKISQVFPISTNAWWRALRFPWLPDFCFKFLPKTPYVDFPEILPSNLDFDEAIFQTNVGENLSILLGIWEKPNCYNLSSRNNSPINEFKYSQFSLENEYFVFVVTNELPKKFLYKKDTKLSLNKGNFAVSYPQESFLQFCHSKITRLLSLSNAYNKMLNVNLPQLTFYSADLNLKHRISCRNSDFELLNGATGVENLKFEFLLKTFELEKNKVVMLAYLPQLGQEQFKYPSHTTSICEKFSGTRVTFMPCSTNADSKISNVFSVVFGEIRFVKKVMIDPNYRNSLVFVRSLYVNRINECFMLLQNQESLSILVIQNEANKLYLPMCCEIGISVLKPRLDFSWKIESWINFSPIFVPEWLEIELQKNANQNFNIKKD